MRKILVLRGGALGDFVVTMPALRLLRERWPDARLVLAGNARAAELGQHAGLLDEVHSQHEARWARLYAPGPLEAGFAAWLAGFDLVVSYWPDPEGTLSQHFPVRPGQHFRAGAAMPASAPAARHYCEVLRAEGLAVDEVDWRSRLEFDLPRTRQVAIHPGSGSPRKNWPLNHWRELCARLPHPPLIVGGEADAKALEALAGCGSLFSGQPVVALARALAQARLFIGHDSGVSHVAAAVGAPCVLLFGPTDPATWAPPGNHVRVLRRATDLSAISVDEVLAACGL